MFPHKKDHSQVADQYMTTPCKIKKSAAYKNLCEYLLEMPFLCKSWTYVTIS